jgi:hypothetical protein
MSPAGRTYNTAAWQAGPTGVTTLLGVNDDISECVYRERDRGVGLKRNGSGK